MKHTVGDKFIIEIEEIVTPSDGKPLAKIKGFNTLVFDESGLSRLKPHNVTKERLELIDELKQAEYNRGVKDAWRAARLIALEEDVGGLSAEEMLQIFGGTYYADVFMEASGDEAIAKIREHESEVHIGDEVTTGFTQFVVTRIDANEFFGMTASGGPARATKDLCRKTGRSFLEASSMIKKMNGGATK